MAIDLQQPAATGGERDLSAQPAPAWSAAPWWRRRHGATLLLVVMVAAVPRVLWLDYARPEPVSDFKHYLDVAINLVDAGFLGLEGPSAWRLPAFPAFLAAALVFTRDTFALSAITVALTLVQVALTYWLAWLVFRRHAAALAAGLAAALTPAFVLYSPVLASEHLLAVLVLASLIAALRSEDARWPAATPVGGLRGRPARWPLAALAGALLGLAVLTRGEAGAYLPAIALVVAAGVWRTTTRRRLLTALGATALVAAALAAVVAPWIIRNETVVGAGAGLSTTGGFNFYLAHSPGPYGWRRPLPAPLQARDEIVRNDLGWRHGLQHVRDHPEDWLPTAREGTSALLGPSSYAALYATVYRDGAHPGLRTRDDLGLRDDAMQLAAEGSRWLLWAGLAGLLLVPVWRRRAWLAVAGITLANWLVYAVIFWAQARYRFVVDALACVAVGALAAAVAAAASWVDGGWPPRR